MGKEINTEFKSELELKDIFISHTEFTRKEMLESQFEMSFSFEHQIIDISETSFKVVLSGKAYSSDESFFVAASVVAFFDIRSELDAEMLKNFKNSSVAIAFPFLRTQITLVSSQSGVPLVLPAININAYLDANETTKG